MTEADFGSNHISVVESPWEARFVSLVRSVEEQLMIASPFIARGAVEILTNELGKMTISRDFQLVLLANFSIPNLANGSVDAASIADLMASIPHVRVHHLPGLHAKAYIADHHTAVVTSANLTMGGLRNNVEYGVKIKLQPIVRAIKQHMEKYAELGAILPFEEVRRFGCAAAELRDLRREVEESGRKRLREELQHRLDAANLQLLRRRAHEETTNSIFAPTVLYILHEGPMKTVDINRRVQSIHPDLCDDAIDRVIDGVHFGKKWKHYVRNAQQYLKRNGLIRREGRHWMLTTLGTQEFGLIISRGESV